MQLFKHILFYIRPLSKACQESLLFDMILRTSRNALFARFIVQC